MLKKIMAEFNVNENEALTIYSAYNTKTTYLLKLDNVVERIDKFNTDISERELYDKFIDMLEEGGVNNKNLKQINGYITISYSKSLARMLKTYCDIFGMERIADATINCYRDLMRHQVKSPTILNFFKNEKGNGIDYYLEEQDV